MDNFPKKTNEKTCCFYNIFSNSISNGTRLTGFTIWIFFPKKCRLFQLNVSFSNSKQLFQKKTMSTPTIFITYFQSSCHFVHAQTLIIWNILQKLLLLFENVHKLLPIFATLSIICLKSYARTYHLYDLFSNFLSSCARSQNFVIWKFLLKKWWLLQNVNFLLFIFATLSNISDRTYQKTYHFFLHILKLRLHIYIFTKFHYHNNFLKEIPSVSIC